MAVYHFNAHWAFSNWSSFTKNNNNKKKRISTSEIREVMLFRQIISHQPGTVEVEGTLLTLIWINLLIKSVHVLAWGEGGGVWQWSGNLFRHRLLCAAREYWDVAGGRRAVEDDCYLERGIRVVWAHHSGHVYLPAWTAQPRGGGRNERIIYLILYFKGGSSVMVKMKKWEGHWARRQGRDSEMHTDGCWQISSSVKGVRSSWAQFWCLIFWSYLDLRVASCLKLFLLIASYLHWPLTLHCTGNSSLALVTVVVSL